MGKTLKTFSIVYERKSGVYRPGETVSGEVVVVLDQPLQLRGVLLRMYGEAHTNWTEQETRTEQRYNEKTKENESKVVSKTIAYFATQVFADNGRKKISNDGQKSEKYTLPAGHHSYKFSVQLPASCAPSFHGPHGYISYYCKARIDRPYRFDHCVKEMFTVLPEINLNRIPRLAIGVTDEQEKMLGCCCCKAGLISFTAKIPKSGYAPGETIVVTVDINNDSRRALREVGVTLKQYSTYTACRQGDDAGRQSTKEESRVLKKATIPLDMEPHSQATKIFSKELRIPAVVPSITANMCRIVQVRYSLSVYLKTAGLSTNLKGRIPVTIGTVPIVAKKKSVTAAAGASAATDADELTEIATPSSPSYQECMFGKVSARNEDDNQYTFGNATYAPRYPVYNNIQPAAVSTTV